MTDFVKPFKNDPQLGNLSTPISDSAIVRAFIGSLPAYRAGLSASRRGLEVGMAHGYFIYGPFAYFGPLRDTELGGLAGLFAAAALVVLLTLGLSLHGQSVTTLQSSSAVEAPADLGTTAGWSEFASSFLVGGAGGVAFAYFLSNLEPFQKFIPLIWS
ncbi:photosystem I reaction center subunit XI [Pseudanabaena sp. Chao 1811]|uniref:photosystem I reaction center subunit XI n=1 Tax=Pseudanabaena sp. Chao 1811 TaxID=2963092 RepID=UPI0022F3B731|nr:photosystem I reaction center subunit XI [Pseudanabaena sp. Chao 1811]